MGHLSTHTLLTEITPFSPNLYEVSWLQGFTTSDQITESPATNLYCTSIDIPVNSLTHKRHPLLRTFLIESVELPNTVSITWSEDKYLTVWKFHQDWIQSSYYDRKKDQYITGASGKKRTARVVFQSQEYTESTKSLAYKDIHIITLNGLSPVSSFSLKGSWSDSPSWPSYTITYNIDSIEVTTQNTLGVQETFTI